MSLPGCAARVLAIGLVFVSTGWSRDPAEVQRSRMVKDQIAARGVTNTAVLAALLRVPRHEFVPATWRDNAYDDGPLPIGHGQTISQPYIVALMTELLRLKPGDKVLEIGTGSGYQAAVLAEITTNVWTIEIVEPLAKSAAETLKRLGYDKVHTRFGDGYIGWKEQAPFDAIIVTAAPDHIPQPLIDQLKPGGRMTIPVGKRFQGEALLLVEKDAQGKLSTREIAAVMFVPLTRQPKP